MISPHVVAVVLLNVALKSLGTQIQWMSQQTQIASFYLFCRPAGLLHDTFLHRNRAESGLMVSLAFWDLSLQERQECVCVGRSGSDVAAGVSRGGGRSENGLNRVVLDEF